MLKDELLKELKNNTNIPISGQEIADKYNVSRNAVWKAVTKLKQEGYLIISSPKGYYLDGNYDVLSEEGIRDYLIDDLKKLPISVYDEIDSTNYEGKRRIASGDISTCLITAVLQNNGRGHNGTTFESPKDLGVYFTVNCKVSYEGISERVLSGIKSLIGDGEKVYIGDKNAIMIGDKKIGGILSEAISDLETGDIECISVGVGIQKNEVSQELFKNRRDQIIATIVNSILS